MPPLDPFHAISDGTRREILAALSDRPLAVHELAARFPMSRPAISRHLRVLGEAGLVTAQRAGKENRYALRREGLAQVADWLAGFWAGRLELLKQLSERNT